MDQSKDSGKARQPFSYASAAKRGQRSDKSRARNEISSAGPSSPSKPVTTAQQKQPKSPPTRQPTSEPQQPTWLDAPPPARSAWGASKATSDAQSKKAQQQSSVPQWTDAPPPTTPAWGLPKSTPKATSQQAPESPKKPFISPAQELLAKHRASANKSPSPEELYVVKDIPHGSQQRLEAFFKQPKVSTRPTKHPHTQAPVSAYQENKPTSSSQTIGSPVQIPSPALSSSNPKSQLSPKERSAHKTQSEVQSPIRASSPIISQPSAAVASPTLVVSFPAAAIQPPIKSQSSSPTTFSDTSSDRAQLLAHSQDIALVSTAHNSPPSPNAQARHLAPSPTIQEPLATVPLPPKQQSPLQRRSPIKSQPSIRGRLHIKTKSAPQVQLVTTTPLFTLVESIEKRPRSRSAPIITYAAAVRDKSSAAEKALRSRPTTPPLSSPAFTSGQAYTQIGGLGSGIIYPETPKHQIVRPYGDDQDEEGSPTPRASAQRRQPSSSGSSTPTQATWAAKERAMAHQFELIERVEALLAQQSHMARYTPGRKRPNSDSGILLLQRAAGASTQPGFKSAGASPAKGSRPVNRKGKDQEIIIPRVLPPMVRRGGFLPFDVRFDEQEQQRQQQQQQQQHQQQEQSAAPSLPPPTPAVPAAPAPSAPPPQEEQHPSSPPSAPNLAAVRATLTEVRILKAALGRVLRRVGSPWAGMTGDGHDEDRFARRERGQFFCAFDGENHEVAGLGRGRPRRPNPNRRHRHLRRHLLLSPRGRHAWRPPAEAPAPPPPPPPVPPAPLSPIQEEEEAAGSSSSSVGPASSEVGLAASPVVPPAAASAPSPPPPVESAATFVPVAAPAAHDGPADSVDTTIGVILSDDERRRRAAMRRALTSNRSLWEHQFGWDVLVRCQDQTWRLHREVLSAQSVYFRDRLAGQGPWVIDCDLHELWQLGSALAFMYLGREYLSPTPSYLDFMLTVSLGYEGSGLTPGQPLDGLPVYRNVAAYVAGASVHCPSMMAFAVRALEAIREALTPVVLTGLFRDDPNVHLFHEPLRLALADMYAQADGPLMEPLRLAMARLVDVVLVSLWGNDAFVKHEMWVEMLFPLCYHDSVRFRQGGLLVGAVPWDQMEILSPR